MLNDVGSTLFSHSGTNTALGRVYEKLAVDLRGSALADHADVIALVAEPTLALESSSGVRTAGIGGNRLGGSPDLPGHMAYPTRDGEPLSFLCQLDMARVGAFDARLPQSGRLYFFIGRSDACDDVESLVLYDDSPVATLQPACAPPGPLRSPADDYAGRPCDIVLRPTLMMPANDFGMYELLPEDCHDAYLEFKSAWQEAEGAEHGLLGTAACDYQLPHDDAVIRYPHTSAPDWLVLARFGWDRNTGFCFWDAGTLNFLVQATALERRDFRDVYAWLITA